MKLSIGKFFDFEFQISLTGIELSDGGASPTITRPVSLYFVKRNKSVAVTQLFETFKLVDISKRRRVDRCADKKIQHRQHRL